MKTTKYGFSFSKLALSAALSVAIFAPVEAQPPVLPSTADNIWFSLPGMPWDLNTAQISINPGINTLYAVVATSGFGVGSNRIWVNDYLSGGSTNFISPVVAAGAADIIIGNSDGTGGRSNVNDFIVATAFVNIAGNPQVDFYDVNNFGPLSITPISSFVVSPGTFNPAHVHIDVIADHSIMAGTGLPFCGSFMLTWDDNTSGQVFVAEGDLNTQTVGAAVMIGPGGSPDVAGIQRGTFLTHSDVALVTYVGPTGNKLMYNEWDVTSGVSPAVVLDAGFTSSSIANPRIDAFDDFSMSSNPGISQYKVVASAASATREVRAYDNLMLGVVASGFDNLSIIPGYGLPSYNNFRPTVALWGPGDYAVFHCVQPLSPWPGSEVLITEPIEMINPLALMGGSYYKVNGIGNVTYSGSSGDFASCVSSAPNDRPMALPELFTWTEPNMSGGFDVKYKISTNLPSFRHSGSNGVFASVVPTEWALYPNPANDRITLKNANEAGTSYKVVDVAGRQVLEGSLQGGLPAIDISHLQKGSFSISVYKGSEAVYTGQFVKFAD
jgi:hypothetical protein